MCYLAADLCHDLEMPMELLKESELVGNSVKAAGHRGSCPAYCLPAAATNDFEIWLLLP